MLGKKKNAHQGDDCVYSAALFMPMEHLSVYIKVEEKRKNWIHIYVCMLHLVPWNFQLKQVLLANIYTLCLVLIRLYLLVHLAANKIIYLYMFMCVYILGKDVRHRLWIRYRYKINIIRRCEWWYCIYLQDLRAKGDFFFISRSRTPTLVRVAKQLRGINPQRYV